MFYNLRHVDRQFFHAGQSSWTIPRLPLRDTWLNTVFCPRAQHLNSSIWILLLWSLQPTVYSTCRWTCLFKKAHMTQLPVLSARIMGLSQRNSLTPQAYEIRSHTQTLVHMHAHTVHAFPHRLWVSTRMLMLHPLWVSTRMLMLHPLSNNNRWWNTTNLNVVMES